MSQFDKAVFEQAFDKSLESLAASEKITKATLLTLSRSVLEAHHATQDIGYINRLIAVLTPINKKAAILYFEAFAGFTFSKEKQEFTKKDKKHYDGKQQEAMAFLEDVNNNIWSWASRNIEMDAKEFDEERMKKALENVLKKADKAGFDQAMVVRGLLAAGLKISTLLAIVEEMGDVQEEPVKEFEPALM